MAFLLISEFARAHGVTILLSGEAADELFGGYPQRYRRYRQFLRARRLLDALPAKIRKAIALAGYACERVPVTTFRNTTGCSPSPPPFSKVRARRSQDSLRGSLQLREERFDRAVLGAMLADVTNFLTPLLRRLDRMSMAASIECRTPFLDHQLVRTVLNLPLSYRLRRGTDKWLLKEVAVRYLPREVVYRRKVGFPLPLADYVAPLAHTEFFHGGFAVECLGIHRKGLDAAIANWRKNVHGFFSMLTLKIRGRLFFFLRERSTRSPKMLRAA